MSASGIAHHADAVHIDAEPRALGAQKLNGCAHILHGPGIEVLGREAIGDGENADAMARQIRPEPGVAPGGAALPRAAMDGHDHGGAGIVRWQVEVACEGLLAPLYEFQVPNDLEGFLWRVMHWFGLLPSAPSRHICFPAGYLQSGWSSTRPEPLFLSFRLAS